MAKMYQIPAALRPKARITSDWELYAASVGIYAQGLRASIGLHNGELQLSETLHLSVPKEREDLATRIAEAIGTGDLPSAIIENYLLQLCDMLDGVLLKLDEESKQRSAKPEAEDEDDMFATPEPEPWDNPVDGSALMLELTETFRRFAILPKGADVALSAWLIHSYAEEAASHSPIILVSAPDSDCGKSTVLKILLYIACRSIPNSNITAPALFRVIDAYAPTIIMDEADAILPDREDLRAVLDSGHERHLAYVLRTVGEDHKPKKFRTWGPKAIACIGGVHRTIKSRSIEISMKRALKEEEKKLTAFPREATNLFADLRRKIRRWTDDNLEALKVCEPTLPSEFRGRRKDNWAPLFAIAQVLGDEWSKKIETASLSLSGSISHSVDSNGSILLKDLRTFFEETHSIQVSTENLLNYLHRLDDRPWSEWGRASKPMSPRQLAETLKPFDIAPKNLRSEGDKVLKGYTFEQCKDAFSRYITDTQNVQTEKDPPKNPHSGRYTATELKDKELQENLSATGGGSVADEKSNNPLQNNTCSTVADKNADMPGQKQTVEPKRDVSDAPLEDDFDEEF